MENLKQEASNIVDEAGQKVQDGASQLPENNKTSSGQVDWEKYGSYI
jgi:hypothetical protein